MHRQSLIPGIVLPLMLSAAAGHAGVTISAKPTRNMSCSGGTCTPTAARAVLNTTDLENYLTQAGNVRVATTGKGVEAKTIAVEATFASPNSSSLTLEANGTIAVDAAVLIGSGSELELQSDTAALADTLSFGQKGHITFASLSDIFGINGAIYTLVDSVPGLAAAVAANPGGFYALGNPYDAGADGTYAAAPVPTTFEGSFEGLGNTIGNLSIADSHQTDNVGLFSYVDTGATLLGVVLSKMSVSGNNAAVAGVAGANLGTISGARVSGVVATQSNSEAGGVAGYNVGTISNSTSAANIKSGSAAAVCEVGGLVGMNYGTVLASRASGRVSGGVADCIVGGLVGENSGLQSVVESSSASGSVGASGTTGGGLVGISYGTITESFATSAVSGSECDVGGLVGENIGAIMNSYAGGPVTGKFRLSTGSSAGGLIGSNFGTTADSYSFGLVRGNNSELGGLIGYDQSDSGSLADTYWDLDSSGITNPDQGAGNIANDPGITGLTTAELQSALPKGFKTKIWTENSTINGGLPYLIRNPPE